MKQLLLTDDELGLLKNILDRDIEIQEKALEEIGDDIRFEMWLIETKIISNKVHALKGGYYEEV